MTWINSVIHASVKNTMIIYSKIYARIVNGRLKPIADALQLEEKTDFRKGRSCIDVIFILKLTFEERSEFRNTSSVHRYNESF